MPLLDCGHPKACWDDDEDDPHCSWCHEVGLHKAAYEIIRGHATQDVSEIVVRNEADVTITCRDLGTLRHTGSGTVNLSTRPPARCGACRNFGIAWLLMFLAWAISAAQWLI